MYLAFKSLLFVIAAYLSTQTPALAQSRATEVGGAESGERCETDWCRKDRAAKAANAQFRAAQEKASGIRPVFPERGDLEKAEYQRLVGENIRALALYDNSLVIEECIKYRIEYRRIWGKPIDGAATLCDTYKDRRAAIESALADVRRLAEREEPREASVALEAGDTDVAEIAASEEAIEDRTEQGSSAITPATWEFDPGDWNDIRRRLESLEVGDRLTYQDSFFGRYDVSPDGLSYAQFKLPRLGGISVDPRRVIDMTRISDDLFEGSFMQGIHCQDEIGGIKDYARVHWRGRITLEGRWVERPERSYEIYRSEICESQVAEVVNSQPEWPNGWKRYVNIAY